MRPVGPAREHGLSTQAIRNYEDAGILPAERTVHGYRTCTPLHAQALRAFLASCRGTVTRRPRRSCGRPTGVPSRTCGPGADRTERGAPARPVCVVRSQRSAFRAPRNRT
ncbi:MerR family DNA-binding transcriptional regulator [Streptosporangium canum]|uniref:MerR family DNA-binding transcriptional regulator n=1 Tax=Streptosporangium canum TaxID=324952 RepID=UPI003F4B2FA8